MSDGDGATPQRPSLKRIGSRQRVSMIESEANPFLSGGGGDGGTTVKVENLADAKPITASENAQIVGLLNTIEDNAGLLRMLEYQKQPYLFTSAQLLDILTSTTSVKTRLCIIQSIGPRLQDPRAKTDELLGLFRYAEEKAKVEEVLKNRSNAINSTLFKQVGTGGSGSSSGGMGGGRSGAVGGRGALGGRGGGAGRGIGATGGRGSPGIGASRPVQPIQPKKEELSSSPIDHGVPLDSVVEGAEDDEEESETPEVITSKEQTTASSTPEPVSDDTPTRKKRSSLIINKRPVTMKTTADIAQSKLESSASKDNNNNEKSVPAPAESTPSKSGFARTAPGSKPTTTPGKPEVKPKPGTTTPVSLPGKISTSRETSGNSVHSKVNPTTAATTSASAEELDEKIQEEILAVMKMLDMDTRVAEEASQDLEMWEMLVVTNKTVDLALNPHPVFLDANGAYADKLLKKRGSSMPVNPKLQKRESFKLLSGVFTSASSAYVAAASKTNPVTPPTTPATTTATNNKPNIAAANGRKSITSWLFDSFGSKPLGDNADVLDGKAEGAPEHDIVKMSDLQKAFNPNPNKLDVPNPILAPRCSTDENKTIMEEEELSPNSRTDPTSRFARMSTKGRGSSNIHDANALYLEAARPSFALGVDPQTFLAMKEEKYLTMNKDNIPQYTYRELVRRNFNKEYHGLIQTDLEQYLNDTEFAIKFGMDKESFKKLPQWKRISLKKALSLF